MNEYTPKYINIEDEFKRTTNLTEAEIAVHFANLIEDILVERSKAAEHFIYGLIIRSAGDLQGGTGDVNVDHYLMMNGWDPVGTNLTPDLCFMLDGILYVGDVAVTVNYNYVIVLKQKKYDELRKLIENKNPNLRVQSYNFVVDISDSEQDILSKTTMFNISTRVVRDEISRLKRYIDVFNSLMSQIKRRLRMNKLFNTLVQKSDVDSKPLIEGYNDNYYYEPQLSEGDLAYQIFDYISGNNVDDSKLVKNNDNLDEAFSKILKENDKMDHREPRTNFPFVLNLDSNEVGSSPFQLIKDYMLDLSFHSDGSEICRMLPTEAALSKMESFYNERNDYSYKSSISKDKVKYLRDVRERYGRIVPFWASVNEMAGISTRDVLKEDLEKNIRKNDLSNNNVKSINSKVWGECYKNQEEIIKYLSQPCESDNRSTNIEFDTKMETNAKEMREKSLEMEILPFYERINKSRAAVLLSNYRKFVNDVSHFPGKMKPGVYYSVNVQKTGIICIYTNNNINASNPFIGFSSISRYRKKDCKNIEEFRSIMLSRYPGLIQIIEESKNYYYVKTKIQKYDLEKLSKLSNIDREFRVHAITMCCLLNDKSDDIIEQYLSRYLGIMACLSSDLHQKPSSLLDLMKYVVNMTFAYRSSIDQLIADKCNIIYKTTLDIWLLMSIKNFYESNVKYNGINKPNKIVYNSRGLSSDSMNVKGNYSMFCNNNIITSNQMLYLTESQLLFHARPKKMYNSQYIDKVANKVLMNNVDMLQERIDQEKRGEDWIIAGIGKQFDFKSEFSYSRDALYYSQQFFEDNYNQNVSSTVNKIRGKLNDFSLNNLSMRGGCKTIEQLRNDSNAISKKMLENEKIGKKYVKLAKSQTALYGGLVELDGLIKTNDSENSKCFKVAYNNTSKPMLFNMSEKEQRGEGRPIGSADFYTKQKLYCIETAYQILSENQNNNLLVRGANRNAKISSANVSIMESSYNNNNKYIAHIVMDQSQFSEGDNINKFIANIQDNSYIPIELKEPFVMFLKQMMDRTQFFPRPVRIDDFVEYLIEQHKYDANVIEQAKNMSREFNGVQGIAGWVQGMLNLSSTHIHIICVEWLTNLFKLHLINYASKFESLNKMSNTEIMSILERMEVKHLVNSDDSYACVTCDSMEIINIYYDFLIAGKKMFTMRQNKKKSYMSEFTGEIIQKYVANGNVINIYGKDAVSVFNNVQGLDPIRDTMSSIGSLQNIYKNGGPELLCFYVKHELKYQIYDTYNFGRGKINDLARVGLDRGSLPIELGGWPEYVTTFELLLSGGNAQLNYFRTTRFIDKTTNEFKLAISSLFCNSLKMTKREQHKKSPLRLFDSNTDVRIKKYIETVEEIENELKNDDEPLNHDYIEFEVDSTVEAFDITQTRSMITPFTFLFPFSRKISKTVEKLKSYDYEGSGLSGLIKTRQSIQKCVADIRENANNLVLELSEEGLTKNVKRKAAASSHITSQSCVTLAGSRLKLTIYKAYKVCLGLFPKFGSSETQSYSTLMEILIEDKTNISQLASEIFTSTNPVKATRVSHFIVNRVPQVIKSIDTVNDLQIVLAFMLDKDILIKENLRLRDPKLLDHDINIVNSVYGAWIRETRNKKDLFKSIYYTHLNSRIKRWHVGPYLNTSDTRTYVVDCFLKCKDGKFIYSSEPIYNQTSKDQTAVVKRIINAIFAAFESLLYLVKFVHTEMSFNDINDKLRYLSKHVYIKDLKSMKVSLFDFFHQGIEQQNRPIIELMKDADEYTIKSIAVYDFLLTGDKSLLRRYSIITTYSHIWIKEQNKFFTMSGVELYKGPFDVVISKGKNVVRVQGEPGNIESITSNTNDVREVERLLSEFTVRVDFGTTYIRPKSKAQWTTPLWKSKVYAPGNYLKIRPNRMSSIVSEDDVCKLTQIKRLLDGAPRDMIPFKFSKDLKSTSEKISTFDNFSVDINNCIVYGHLSHSTMPDEESKKIVLAFKRLTKCSDYNDIEFSDTIKLGNLPVNDLNSMSILRKIVRGQIFMINKDELFTLIMKMESIESITSYCMLSMINENFISDNNIFKKRENLEVINIDLDSEINWAEVGDIEDDPDFYDIEDPNIMLDARQVINALICHEINLTGSKSIIQSLLSDEETRLKVIQLRDMGKLIFNDDYIRDLGVDDDDITEVRDHLLSAVDQTINRASHEFIKHRISRKNNRLAELARLQHNEIIKLIIMMRLVGNNSAIIQDVLDDNSYDSEISLNNDELIVLQFLSDFIIDFDINSMNDIIMQ